MFQPLPFGFSSIYTPKDKTLEGGQNKTKQSEVQFKGTAILDDYRFTYLINEEHTKMVNARQERPFQQQTRSEYLT